jgi:outer membrane receptor protein involved in Fe transport
MLRHRLTSHVACFLLPILLTVLVVGPAEGAEVAGRVIDKITGAPIEGVNIAVSGEKQTSTDQTGRFVLTGLAEDTHTLRLSHVGYRTRTAGITAVTGETVDSAIVFEMEPVAAPVGSITVTSGRVTSDDFSLPVSVAVATADEFDETEFSSTAEVLREEVGVLVQKTTYGHGSPIVRGLIGKYVLLLYDGISLNKPTFRFGANQYLNTVDMETLDRVELVRGPSSVMFGSDAIGGVINLIPRRLPLHNEQVWLDYELNGRYSSADEGGVGHLRVSGGGRRLAASYDLSYKNIGDLRAGGNIGVQKPTGWDEINQAFSLAFTRDSLHRVRLDVVSVGQNEVPRYDKYVDGSFDEYHYDPQNRLLTALTFDDSKPSFLCDSSRIAMTFQREEEGRTLRRAGADAYSEATDKITTWGGYFQLHRTLRRHQLTYGYESYYHNVRTENVQFSAAGTEALRPDYPDRSKFASRGVFIQDEWLIRPEFRLTGGMRFSWTEVDSPLEEPFGRYEKTYSDLTGSLGISYFVSPRTNLVASWSRGFRAPSLNDAVTLKYSSSGVDAPSPGLSSETSDNFEIGMKTRGERLSSGLFVFYNRLNGIIEREHGTYQGLSFFDEDGDGIQDEGEFNIYQKFNSGRGRIYGVEGEADFAASRTLRLETGLAWTYGENQTFHEPMSRIPPLMGRVACRWYLRPDWSVRAETRFAGDQRRLSERDRDDSRIDPRGTPGWAILNLGSRLELDRVTLTISLNNVLDEAYNEHGSGIYSPGRNLVLVLKCCGF